MTKIEFIPKPRKERGGGLYIHEGEQIVSGKDWARQNQINEDKAKTEARSCFRACRTCNACANSCRDNSDPRSYDANARTMVDCRGCEPNRFHDCHNGWMRDSRGEAEPFTKDALKLFAEGGRPLI